MSGMYRFLKRPIERVVLDEAHMAKNFEGETAKAIKHMFYRKMVCQ